jgi:predicted nucleic acid-binding protein
MSKSWLAGFVEFTLTDTGPLVALIDEDDGHFQQAQDALKRLPKVPLRVTWPCLTEAMYLLFRAGGYAAQERHWNLFFIGAVELHVSVESEWRRMRSLMAT